MKSKTSFFNATALKKDITRFAPLWGLYTVFLLLVLLAYWGSGSTGCLLMESLPYLLAGMGILNMLYAGLAALLLFGDLHKMRLCNALHALPLRREGWFFTHLTAGLLFCLIPNLLAAGIGALLLQEFAYGAAIWLAVMVLEYIVFFGIGVFSAMCAGSGLGMVAVYTIINFLMPIVALLTSIFYDRMLYGITVDVEAISNFSPVVILTRCEFIEIYDPGRGADITFRGFFWDNWVILGIAAAVGLCLLVLALLLYRKRNLETAGDFISFRPAAPVFLGLYTLCIAAILFYITEELTGSLSYVFLVAGMGIGFFTGRMLLEKKGNVFRGKNFLAWGIFTTVLFLTMLLTALDPVGITRYVPDKNKVESVRISPYSSAYSVSWQSVTLTDPEEIGKVTELHRAALEDRNGQSDTIHITYTLKNGTTLNREYDLPLSADTTQLKRLYSRPECVFMDTEPQWLLEHATRLELQPYYDADGLPALFMFDPLAEGYHGDQTEENTTLLRYRVEEGFANHAVATGLMEALLQDCHDGTMAQWQNDNRAVAWLSFDYTTEDGGRYGVYITIYENCENTLHYLKSLEQ